MKIVSAPFFFLFFGFILSCTNIKTVQRNIDKNELEKRAEKFMESRDYLKAILCYDTLISNDSTNGLYFMSRGYCKNLSNPDDSGAVTDYLKAIKNNFSKKEWAYYYIGKTHRFKAVLRCQTDTCRILEYDSALSFYNESLKIDSNFSEVIQEKAEVVENLRQLKAGHWGNPK